MGIDPALQKDTMLERAQLKPPCQERLGLNDIHSKILQLFVGIMGHGDCLSRFQTF